MLLGDRFSLPAWAGIGLALPAVAMVSTARRESTGHGDSRAGVLAGLVAGLGFALLFVTLAQAGTGSGAWPLLPGQGVAVAVVAAAAFGGRSSFDGNTWRPALGVGSAAGLLAGAANLLYLAATGVGQLAVVAVVTALYPALTVLLARVGLGESWSRVQAAGLLLAAAAVALITAG